MSSAGGERRTRYIKKKVSEKEKRRRCHGVDREE